jgi:hypothetical protein
MFGIGPASFYDCLFVSCPLLFAAILLLHNRAEWGEVLQDLPSAMMAAAKANARVDDFLSIHELDTSVLLAEEEAPLLVH